MTLDEARRRDLFFDLQRVVAENVPMIYLPSLAALYASHPRVENYDPDPYLTGLHNAWELDAR